MSAPDLSREEAERLLDDLYKADCRCSDKKEHQISIIITALSRARAAAIEECCRASCLFCRIGESIKQDKNGNWSHYEKNLSTVKCQAAAIRELGGTK